MLSRRYRIDAFFGSFVPRMASALFALILLSLLVCPSSGFAADEASPQVERHFRSEASFVTIAELVGANEDYNGSYVEVEGEVVGEIINGDNPRYCWVNLSSGGATIGVYMPVANAAKVKNLGRYGVMGTTLAVYGIYHTACNEGHEGELDIHADIVEIKSLGGVVEDKSLDVSSAKGALWLVGIGLVLLALYAYLKQNGEKLRRRLLKPRK